MQSLINFSFSQCTDKGMFYSLFTVPLFYLSVPPIAPPPHTKATSSLPRQRPPSQLLFLKNHRIPFFLFLPNYYLTLFVTPISYFTWTECCCCIFLQFVFSAGVQLSSWTNWHNVLSCILAARSILHTKLHLYT